ncbi:hypothetical protein ETD86_11740 [Nonomuraea turkmeniaca]|uniref:Uncharacterized protein n=1 Tax=Nonomuraea turkmeniaca TaxID=103838 RepID=A0A5S4FNV5_9ACTN|nr:hypothetical protein [Nonomuraea turkmeniaca]TMR22365.1 hypothetical protein ETD86_11740 [Nonomuraea turkmeniaca]
MGDWVDEPIVDPTMPVRDRSRFFGTPWPLLGPSDHDTPRWARWLLGGGAVVTGAGGALFTIAVYRTDMEAAGLAVVMVFCIMLLLFGISRPDMGHRQRRYAGRYVVPAQLDSPALDLLARARQAVMEVSGSRVHRLGLLDAIANDVVLPERLWEIASLLRTHTELRAEQAAALAEVMTPELTAVLEAQREALGRSVAAVAGRVRELEAYASRVREADAALRAQELQKSHHRYRDLLAQTGDTEGLRHLIGQAGALTKSLHEEIALGTETIAGDPEPRTGDA